MSGSADVTSSDHALATIADHFHSAMVGKRWPQGFSDESVTVVLERQAEYLEDIAATAVRLARRAKSDVISAHDVERADEAVRTGSASRRLASVEALGGLLAGAGLSQLFAVLTATDAGSAAIGVGAAALALGAVLLTYGIARR